MKRIGLILSILISISILFGIGWKIDRHYAKAFRLQLVEQRLDQKIVQDKVDWMQERIWKLEDRYRGKQMPASTKEEYRRLKKEIRELRRR